MQPALHTHPQSGNAHERKSTKALAARLSTILQLPFFPFWWNNTFCWRHSWLGGLILAATLAETSGWLNDHVCVTGYLGRVTRDTFAWPRCKQHILLLPEQNKPCPQVEAEQGIRPGKHILEWGRYQSLCKLHSGWHVVPASQQNATWLACSFCSAHQR